MPIPDREFVIDGQRYRLAPDYYSIENPPPEPESEEEADSEAERGLYTDEEVDTVLRWCEVYWRRYLDLGFVTFGRRSGNTYVYAVRFDRNQASNAYANNTSMTIGANQIRNADLDGLRAVIIHELFHACQFASSSGSGISPAFTEGTADVAKYLMEPEIRSSISIPSLSAYLDHPGESMWDRPTPGRDHSSRSTPTLFWLYFVTQLGRRTADPGRYTDALRDLLNSRNVPEGDAAPTPTVPLAVARFLENDDEQLLLRSEDSQSLALVSANRSYGIHGATHWRLNTDQRWGASGWRFRAADQVRGSGDLIGAGRHQLVLQSSNPTHIGIVGYAAADGSPDSPVSGQTHAVVGEGDRWGGGWRVRRDDRVQAVGRFRDPERSCIIVSSQGPGYLGVLFVDDSGAPQTGAVVQAGQSLGDGGWVYNADDEIVATGDFRSAGTEQFVIRSASPTRLGIIGLDADGKFATVAVVATDGSDRFGTGWKLRDNDRILGTGSLTRPGRADLIIQSSGPAYLGVVGLDETGRTETRFAIRAGSALGTDWRWQPGDQLMGIGRFLDGDREQVAWLAADRRRVAIIGFDARDKPVTHEYIDPTHGKGLGGSDIEALAVGNMAGLPTDQLLARTDSTVQLLRLEQPYLDEPNVRKPDPGLWRTRWYVGRTIRMQSTHSYLDNFVQRQTRGQRTFESLFWDFTISNLTRELAGAPPALRYPVAVDSHPVATQPVAFNSREGGSAVGRWSARYFDLPLAPEPGRVELSVSQAQTGRRLNYAAVVADSSGNLKHVHRHTGTSWHQRIDVGTGDHVTLIVTATYAPAEIEADFAFAPVAVIRRGPARRWERH